MKRSKKQEIVEILKKDFNEYDTALMVDYRGLSVAEITDLRNRLREESCTMKVIKNTLCVRASEGTQYESFKDEFQGPNAIVFTKDNPVPMAKILTEYTKTSANLQVRVGFLKGKKLTPDQIKEVAKLPSKEVILAQLLSVMQAPSRNIVSMIQAPYRSLVQVLGAIRDKKE